MKIVIITCKDNQLGGILGSAYKNNNGIPFNDIIILPKRKHLDFPVLSKLYFTFKFFTIKGMLRLLKYEIFRFVLSKKEKEEGFGVNWLDSLSFQNTAKHYIQSTKTNELSLLLKSISPDLIISIGAPIIFKNEILNLPTIGSINVHNGLIPKYRGHFGTFWEILNNEKHGYVSIHEMVAKVDSGRIVEYGKIDMKKCKSFLEIMIEKKRIGGSLLAKVILKIAQEKKLPPTPDGYPENQNQSYYSFPKIKDISKFSWRNFKD